MAEQQSSRDPNASSSSSSTSRKRGRTRGLSINSRTGSNKKDLELDKHDIVVGANAAEASTYSGLLARMPTLLPLNYPDWRKVPNHHKEDAWKKIEEKFNVSKDAQRVIFMRMSHSWRDFKAALKKETEIKYPNFYNAPRPTDPVDTPADQWAYLIGKWTSENWQYDTYFNDGRENQQVSHTTGRKSFAQVAHEMRLEHPDGADPTRVQVFKKTHQRRDGSYINQATRDIIDKFEEKLEELPPEMRETSVVQNDLFVEAFGVDPPGRVRGAGLGVKPSTLGLTQRNIEERREKEERQREFAMMKEEIADLKRVVADLSQILRGRSSSESSTHLCK
ncbi:uncharacterized protein LOC122659125 [Telopea speciosissima]|uniref:uncharacterized protein LOC122659125 n=1 Tax=Telopea speciosissima TaxID=54955 RepID=UPI001CC55F44|nr:uncharacterized protein LOC122659125 [Telopea speciosissima]